MSIYREHIQPVESQEAFGVRMEQAKRDDQRRARESKRKPPPLVLPPIGPPAIVNGLTMAPMGVHLA